jgi:putative transposase
VRRLVDEFRASERRVCGLMGIPRMSYRYRCRRDDSALRERLLALAREKPRFGYRRLWVMLTSEEQVNHKRVWRVYRDLGLSVKRTRRKRLERALRPRPILTAPNQEWAVDFVSDVSARGAGCASSL